MANLIAKSPCADLLPLTVGALVLEEVEERLTSLARYDGKAVNADKALLAAHGVGFPVVGQSISAGPVRVIWFGPEQAMLIGPAPAASLSESCAVTDQSDAWCRVRLSGASADQVLARLVPIDLRLPVFTVGSVARSELFHMAAVISRVAEDVFEIMVFRSMAGTLVHDLKGAMKSVTAQLALRG